MCLWFLARDKGNRRFRERRGETLFIDARGLGEMEDRTHRILPAAHTAQIAGTYHAWRGDAGAGAYADIPGFCKAAALDEIKANGYVLTPGRYVGAAAGAADSEPFAEKMARLTATLEQQFSESARLENIIRESLRRIGYTSESE